MSKAMQAQIEKITRDLVANNTMIASLGQRVNEKTRENENLKEDAKKASDAIAALTKEISAKDKSIRHLKDLATHLLSFALEKATESDNPWKHIASYMGSPFLADLRDAVKR